MKKQILLAFSLCTLTTISMQPETPDLESGISLPMRNPRVKLFGPRDPNRPVEITFKGKVIKGLQPFSTSFNHVVSKKKNKKNIPLPNLESNNNNNNDIDNNNLPKEPSTPYKKRKN